MKLVAESAPPRFLAPSDRSVVNVLGLGTAPEIEVEIDAMLADLRDLTLDLPDEVMRTCTGFMARCTEIYIKLIRIEGREREFRFLRTQQLTKVMELIEFYYKAASRYIELRRQDSELSR